MFGVQVVAEAAQSDAMTKFQKERRQAALIGSDRIGLDRVVVSLPLVSAVAVVLVLVLVLLRASALVNIVVVESPFFLVAQR